MCLQGVVIPLTALVSMSGGGACNHSDLLVGTLSRYPYDLSRFPGAHREEAALCGELRLLWELSSGSDRLWALR